MGCQDWETSPPCLAPRYASGAGSPGRDEVKQPRQFCRSKKGSARLLVPRQGSPHIRQGRADVGHRRAFTCTRGGVSAAPGRNRPPGADFGASRFSAARLAKYFVSLRDVCSITSRCDIVRDHPRKRPWGGASGRKVNSQHGGSRGWALRFWL